MAARAYDVAAMSLKGASAHLNFPELASSLPRPVSLSPRDIQTAAAAAAAAWRNRVPVPSAKYQVRPSGRDQGRSIEKEEITQANGDCFGGLCVKSEGADEVCDQASKRGQCEQGKEGRLYSPVPEMFSLCEDAEHFYNGIGCAHAGDDLFNEEMRYVFTDMAEAMFIASPPRHSAVGEGLDDEEVDDRANWDFWLWDSNCAS